MAIDDAIEEMDVKKVKEKKQKGSLFIPQWQEQILEDYRDEQLDTYQVFLPQFIRFDNKMKPLVYFVMRDLVDYVKTQDDELAIFLQEKLTKAEYDKKIAFPYDEEPTKYRILNREIKECLAYDAIKKAREKSGFIYHFSFTGLLIEHGKEFVEILDYVSDKLYREHREGLENPKVLFKSEKKGIYRVRSAVKCFDFYGHNLNYLMDYLKQTNAHDNVKNVIKDLEEFDVFNKKHTEKPDDFVTDSVFERLKKYNPNLVYETSDSGSIKGGLIP